MSSYKQFVRDFLAKEKASGNTSTPTERMVACAAAWRKEHPKAEKVVKVPLKKEGKVSKVKNESTSAAPKKPFTFSGVDVGSMLFSNAVEPVDPMQKGRKVFAIRKTKANQRQLNNAVRSFAKDVKLGAVTNVNEAFARGLKCLYDLHGQPSSKKTAPADV